MKPSKNILFTSILYFGLLLLVGSSSVFAQRVEIPNKRTLFSATYRNPDNSLTTEISAAPVHYRDEMGVFQSIDRNLAPSNTAYDYEVTTGLYNAYFKNNLNSSYPVVFESKDGAALKMKLTAVAYLDRVSKEYQILQNIQTTIPEVSENQIVYPDAFSNVDVKYVYTDTRLKEEIFLTQQARDNLPNPANFGITQVNAYLVFVTRLDIDQTLPAFAGSALVSQNDYEGDGRINFKNIKGAVKFFLPVDWAFMDADRDNPGQGNRLKIRKRLIHRNGNHFLLTGVKVSNLANMPQGTVVFDPQVELNYQPNAIGGYDTYIVGTDLGASILKVQNYGTSNILFVGRFYLDPFFYTRGRSLLHFDLTAIPSNGTVLSAIFSLNDFISPTQPNTTLNIHKMLTDWEEGNKDGTEGQASWEKRAEASYWGELGGQPDVEYENAVSSSIETDGSSAWHHWDVTNLVSFWVSNPENNFGMMVKYDNDDVDDGNDHHFLFYSSDDNNISNRPKLSITYIQNFATVYYVRDAAGNVIATYRK